MRVGSFLPRLGVALGLAAGLFAAAGPPARAEALKAKEFDTAVDYVVEFYPLWFTYYQSQVASINRLVGPVRISPLYHIVVAINDDTLYASTFLDLSGEPVILEIPKTEASYSILTLDPFGNIFDSGLPSEKHGLFGLTGPDFKGKLPDGVKRIRMPLNFQSLIFRVDKHSADGKNETREANDFRKSLKTLPLCAYLGEDCPDGTPPGGKALILPEAAFSEPFKQTADALVTKAPIQFLKELQVAVASSNTPPLSNAQQTLSERFDKLFGDGENLGPTARHQFSQGARTAHGLILASYLDNTGPTNWIHFTNIGDWGKRSIERSAITEFIQYGNGIATAAYYHAFKDEKGRALDGTEPLGYALHFAADQIPEASRFWSLTAYTPDAIELVKNSAKKYVVASYTKGLQYNQDGSLTVFLSRNPPVGEPEANWLPVPPGQFNIMLRVYGPEGSVADDTYVPPAIVRRK